MMKKLSAYLGVIFLSFTSGTLLQAAQVAVQSKNQSESEQLLIDFQNAVMDYNIAKIRASVAAFKNTGITIDDMLFNDDIFFEQCDEETPSSDTPPCLSALHYAAWDGNVDVIRELHRLGANINVRSQTTHETPLMVAVGFDQVTAVIELLRLGANASLKDDDGNTALNSLNGRYDKQIVPLLLQAGAEPDREFFAYIKDKPDIMAIVEEEFKKLIDEKDKKAP